MSLTAPARGFVLLLLLSVSVVQAQDVWGVIYASLQICASEGSAVDMNCTFIYPSQFGGVKQTFWLTKSNNFELKNDLNYAGRVNYHCDGYNCRLEITDLRESDSARYKFRFLTTSADGKYTGDPGVKLSVTALQMKVNSVNVSQSYTEAELTCHSGCSSPSYVWLKNGQKVPEEASSYTGRFNPGDSISCALKGREDYPTPSLYAPKVPSVSVSPSGEIVEGSLVTLSCSRDANVASYTWYKNPKQELLSDKPQLVFSSIQSSDSGEYYCAAENELGRRTSEYFSINVHYAPKISSPSVSPSGEIVEGSSVTLSCSSDANPAAKYTWYKENQTLLQGAEGSYHFTSISSEDSGIYHCKSENKYGEINSASLFIDVLYAPKLPSVSVSPSCEIVEGSSVTLNCSSDANPAAKYTWYKKNQTLLQGAEGSYHFTSISSEDFGTYYCKSENLYGEINSTFLFLNVQYAPKLPSVSVSPSAEIVEGSSVTLSCSSDANPAAKYTWYKENEDSAKASGQIFSITDFRAEHSGSYYCVAENRRGRRNNTLHLTVAALLDKSTMIMNITLAMVVVVVVLLILLILVCLLMRKKKVLSCTKTNEPTEAVELESDNPYVNVSDVNAITAAKTEDKKE